MAKYQSHRRGIAGKSVHLLCQRDGRRRCASGRQQRCGAPRASRGGVAGSGRLGQSSSFPSAQLATRRSHARWRRRISRKPSDHACGRGSRSKLSEGSGCIRSAPARPVPSRTPQTQRTSPAGLRGLFPSKAPPSFYPLSGAQFRSRPGSWPFTRSSRRNGPPLTAPS